MSELGGWLKEVQLTAAEYQKNPSEDARAQDVAEAVQKYDEIGNLLDRESGTTYQDLPTALRMPIYRFVRTFQYLLNMGAKPENILNLQQI